MSTKFGTVEVITVEAVPFLGAQAQVLFECSDSIRLSRNLEVRILPPGALCRGSRMDRRRLVYKFVVAPKLKISVVMWN